VCQHSARVDVTECCYFPPNRKPHEGKKKMFVCVCVCLFAGNARVERRKTRSRTEEENAASVYFTSLTRSREG
jgi:hypothetical protein